MQDAASLHGLSLRSHNGQLIERDATGCAMVTLRVLKYLHSADEGLAAEGTCISRPPLGPSMLCWGGPPAGVCTCNEIASSVRCKMNHRCAEQVYIGIGQQSQYTLSQRSLPKHARAALAEVQCGCSLACHLMREARQGSCHRSVIGA